MDNQNKFIEMIEDVTELAKINKREVTKDFLQEYFKELELNESQMQLVYDYMTEHNIAVKGYDKKTVDNSENNYESAQDDEPESEYLNIYKKEVEMAKSVTQPLDELVIKMCDGDETSRENIVNFFLPKVIKIAEKYKMQGLPQSDLIQEGNIGILLGMSKLSGKETSEEIENIVTESITQSMLNAIDELSAQKKTSRRIIRKADMLKEKAEELAETMNDKLTMQEMADYMEMDLSEIEDILRMTGEQL